MNMYSIIAYILPVAAAPLVRNVSARLNIPARSNICMTMGHHGQCAETERAGGIISLLLHFYRVLLGKLKVLLTEKIVERKANTDAAAAPATETVTETPNSASSTAQIQQLQTEVDRLSSEMADANIPHKGTKQAVAATSGHHHPQPIWPRSAITRTNTVRQRVTAATSI